MIFIAFGKTGSRLGREKKAKQRAGMHGDIMEENKSVGDKNIWGDSTKKGDTKSNRRMEFNHMREARTARGLCCRPVRPADKEERVLDPLEAD